MCIHIYIYICGTVRNICFLTKFDRLFDFCIKLFVNFHVYFFPEGANKEIQQI